MAIGGSLEGAEGKLSDKYMERYRYLGIYTPIQYTI